MATTTMTRLRGTGRTSRLFDHAKRLAAERGFRVLVVVESQQQRDEWQQRVDHDLIALGLFEVSGSVKVTTLTSLGPFDWRNFRALQYGGPGTGTVVLIDHYVIETRFPLLIDMLHWYDRPEESVTRDHRYSTEELPHVPRRD